VCEQSTVQTHNSHFKRREGQCSEEEVLPNQLTQPSSKPRVECDEHDDIFPRTILLLARAIYLDVESSQARWNSQLLVNIDQFEGVAVEMQVVLSSQESCWVTEACDPLFPRLTQQTPSLIFVAMHSDSNFTTFLSSDRR
jgi:hypothetical protein